MRAPTSPDTGLMEQTMWNRVETAAAVFAVAMSVTAAAVLIIAGGTLLIVAAQ